MENENKNPNPKVQWWKSLLAKKWTFPAIYLVASVLIVTLLWTRTDTGNYQLSKDYNIISQQEEYVQEEPVDSSGLELDNLEVADVAEMPSDAVPVVSNEPIMQWPLAVTEEADIVTHFYDQNAENDRRAEAIYEYDRTIFNSTGIDIIKGEEKFDVLAVAAGKVVIAEDDVLHGKKIKIAHADGLETVYASLSELTVQVGNEVKAGDKLGQAGQCQIKSDLPNHLYFEVYQAGQAIDPVSVLPALTSR
jgi:stage II sporulation protein Q